MSPIFLSILVSIGLFLGGLIMAIIGYFLKQLVEQLKELNKTVSALQNELGILVNDHDNLKDKVEKIEHKLKMD